MLHDFPEFSMQPDQPNPTKQNEPLFGAFKSFALSLSSKVASKLDEARKDFADQQQQFAKQKKEEGWSSPTTSYITPDQIQQVPPLQLDAPPASSSTTLTTPSFLKNLAPLSKNLQSMTSNLTQTIVQSTQEMVASLNKSDARSESAPIVHSMLPWSDLDKEQAEAESQIRALSADERNFLLSPPPTSDFVFEARHWKQAEELLKIDDKLSEKRYQLVPKNIKEEVFWKNYFYRVSLIIQSLKLKNALEESEKRQVGFNLFENNRIESQSAEQDIQVAQNNDSPTQLPPPTQDPTISPELPEATESPDLEDWEEELKKELEEL